MPKLTKKELLKIYLDNVDKYEFAHHLGDMQTTTCALGVIAKELTYLQSEEKIEHGLHTTGVINYLVRKGANRKILNKIVELNDSSSYYIETPLKEQAKSKITKYLSE